MMELRALEAEFKPKMYKALGMDGKDDYVEVPDSPTIRDWSNGITVICWAKSNTESWNSWGMLVSKRNSFILHPWKDTKGISFYIYGVTSGWVHAGATADVDLTKWNMWFGIYDKSRIYVGWNGEIKSYNDFTEDVASDTGIIAIGRDDGSSDRFFDGQIRSVYIYDIALSKSEIKHLYRNPFDPPEIEHLVLWFTPGSIDLANGKWWDLSGKNNHGIIYGCNEVLLTEPEVAVV